MISVVPLAGLSSVTSKKANEQTKALQMSRNLNFCMRGGSTDQFECTVKFELFEWPKGYKYLCRNGKSENPSCTPVQIFEFEFLSSLRGFGA